MKSLQFSSESLNILEKKIGKLVASRQMPVLVSIAGGSCAGKSTQLVSQLKENLSFPVTLVHQDHYQLGKAGVGLLDPLYGADDPANYGIEAAYDLLQALTQGKVGSMPMFNFQEKQRTGTQTIAPEAVILFEGLYALMGPLAGLADLAIYLEMPWWGRMCRRIFRNTRERYKDYPVDKIIQSFLERVQPAHEAFNLKQREAADFVLNHTFSMKGTLEYFGMVSEGALPKAKELFQRAIDPQSLMRIVKTHAGCEFQLGCDGQLYLKSPVSERVVGMLERMDYREPIKYLPSL